MALSEPHLCFLHSTLLTWNHFIICINFVTRLNSSSDVCSPSTKHNILNLNKYLVTILWIFGKVKPEKRKTPKTPWSSSLPKGTRKLQKQDWNPGLAWLPSLHNCLLWILRKEYQSPKNQEDWNRNTCHHQKWKNADSTGSFGAGR